jgi:hypothetical protein
MDLSATIVSVAVERMPMVTDAPTVAPNGALTHHSSQNPTGHHRPSTVWDGRDDRDSTNCDFWKKENRNSADAIRATRRSRGCSLAARKTPIICARKQSEA